MVLCMLLFLKLIVPTGKTREPELLKKYHNKQADNAFDTQLSTLLAHENFKSKRVPHVVKPSQ